MKFLAVLCLCLSFSAFADKESKVDPDKGEYHEKDNDKDSKIIFDKNKPKCGKSDKGCKVNLDKFKPEHKLDCKGFSDLNLADCKMSFDGLKIHCPSGNFVKDGSVTDSEVLKDVNSHKDEKKKSSQSAGSVKQ